LTERSTQKFPIAVLLGTLLLAGCGVKGALEPPPGTEAVASPAPNTVVRSDAPAPSVTSTQTQTTSSNFVRKSAGQEQPTAERKKRRLKQGNVPVTSEPVKPDAPFILDSLL
jgi:predicted small lipoprotein YifL